MQAKTSQRILPTIILFALAMYLLGQQCEPAIDNSYLSMHGPHNEPLCVIFNTMTEPPEIQLTTLHNNLTPPPNTISASATASGNASIITPLEYPRGTTF